MKTERKPPRSTSRNKRAPRRPSLADARAAGRAFLLRPASDGAAAIWLKGAYAWVDEKLPIQLEGETDEGFVELINAMNDAFMEGVQEGAAALNGDLRVFGEAPVKESAGHVLDELKLTRDVFQRTQALFHALRHVMAAGEEPDFDHKLLAQIGIELMGLHWKRTAELCKSIGARSG